MNPLHTATELSIPSRFNGPENSANGGYSCGLVAGLIEGDAEVTLRSPPPLATTLRVAQNDNGVEVSDGSALVATACSIDFAPPAVPATPGWDEATVAATRYVGHERHEFPTCFTCGPARSDGLGIFAGATGTGVVAAPWLPDDSLPNSSGVVAAPIVWAALDCPGAWVEARDATAAPVLLGRMAARIDAPILVGHRYVAIAWSLGDDGRKSFAATALIDESGRPMATARQTWITVG